MPCAIMREHLRLFEWLSELLDHIYTQANAFPNLNMVQFVFQITMEELQFISIHDERYCWEKDQRCIRGCRRQSPGDEGTS
jgi:hypothetical protein